jgi:hypothetical protein
MIGFRSLIWSLLVLVTAAASVVSAALPKSQVPCCTIAKVGERPVPGAPSVASVQQWLAKQTFMQCKSTLSNEIGSEFNLPGFRFPSEYSSVLKRLDLGIPTFRSPPFQVPPYLSGSLIRRALGKFDRPPFVLYLAYDQAIRAVIYYQVGNEFESVGYMADVTPPPDGTPQINLRAVIRLASVMPGDLLRDAVRGLPTFAAMTRTYGKPKDLRPQCGLLQLSYIGPRDSSYNPNRPNLPFVDLAYSPEGVLRVFDLVEAES